MTRTIFTTLAVSIALVACSGNSQVGTSPGGQGGQKVAITLATGGISAGTGGAVFGFGGSPVSGFGGASGKGGVPGTGGRPDCVLKDDPTAPFVDYQRTSEPAPAAVGGVITGGTYFLTDLTYHGGTQVPTECAMNQVHEVRRFTATSDTEGIMHSSMLTKFSDGSGRNQYPSESTYRVDGSLLRCSHTCSSPSDFTEKFTATSQRILFIRGPFDGSCDKGVTLVLTYDKQP
jgi:hypothetical protein